MTRIKTGLALILVGGSALCFGGVALFLFLLVVGCLAFYEIQQLSELKSITLMVVNMVVYAGIIGVLCLSSYGIIVPNGWGAAQFETIKWILVALILLCFCIFFTEYVQKKLLFRSYIMLNNLKFFLYIAIGFGAIYVIRHIDGVGMLITMIMFLAIWATDVFAYYGGKRFGKHPLSPISPKKTVEGTVIGIAVAMIAASLLVGLVGQLLSISPLAFILLVGGIGAIAQFGDLYESLIKRTYNVKDSSNILPGHGGILDRADSTLFVSPLVLMIIILGS